jgi:hypothetical protein
MSWALVGLLSGFIMVLVLLYYLLIKSSLGLTLKVCAVFVVSLFYWVQYEALQQYTGWPSHDELPQNFILLAAYVQEPGKQSGEAGAMYWWVRDSTRPDLPPRVFHLPYRIELHEQAAQIVAEQKKGGVYLGKTTQQGAAGRGQGIRFEKVSKSERNQKSN